MNLQSNRAGTLSFSLRASLLALSVAAIAPSAKGDIYLMEAFGRFDHYTDSGAFVDSFVPPDLEFAPAGVFISGSTLYVTNSVRGTISTYTLDGQEINHPLVTGLNHPAGIAVSGDDLFVVNSGTGTIGEYTTSGATINPSLISGLSSPYALTISGSSIFVDDSSGTTARISEYSLTGAPIGVPLISNLNFSPGGFAVFGDDIFISDSTHSTVLEYSTSGTLLNASLINLWPNDLGGIAILNSDLLLLNPAGLVSEYTTSGQLVNSRLMVPPEFELFIQVTPTPETETLALMLAPLGAALMATRIRPTPV